MWIWPSQIAAKQCPRAKNENIIKYHINTPKFVGIGWDWLQEFFPKRQLEEPPIGNSHSLTPNTELKEERMHKVGR